jgi:hypothetical protein
MSMKRNNSGRTQAKYSLIGVVRVVGMVEVSENL